MKWTAEQIIDFVQNWKEEQEYICEKTTTKEGRTLAQNRTWSKILTAIWQHKYWDLAQAKKITLIYKFWYETQEYEWETVYIPNYTSTAALSKKEGIEYLTFLIDYCKDEEIPVQITPREINSLYESFSN